MINNLSLLNILYIIRNKLMSTFQHKFNRLAIHKISANKTFIVTNSLVSQLFVVAFVYPTYVQLVHI